MAIYDCFTFFNEVELLEMRLRMLGPYVDYFVISELPATFRGEKRPLVFESYKEKFREFSDKIIYVTSDYIPDGSEAWAVESWQRNCIMKGLSNCKPDDIIMISDIDEIPNPEILKNFKEIRVKLSLKGGALKRILYSVANNSKKNAVKLFKESKLEDILKFSPVVCNQRLFYYYLNNESYAKWNGTVILKYKYMQMPHNIRMIRGKIPRISDGGWHFSFMGGVERVREKLKNSGNDWNGKLMKIAETCSSDENYIINCMKRGVDIYGRKKHRYHFITQEEIGIADLEQYFPGYKKWILDLKDRI